MNEDFKHYFRDVKHLKKIDIYRILELYATNEPIFDHVIKKLLAAGERGGKSKKQDVDEAIRSLQRWVEMRDEDAEKPITQKMTMDSYRDCYDTAHKQVYIDALG